MISRKIARSAQWQSDREVGYKSKMAAVKKCSTFLIHFLLISTALSSSSEDFFSNYNQVEDIRDTQISSDNPTYSETSTHTGISEPYLDMDGINDEELQIAVTKQSLEVPETLEEVTLVSF